MGQYTSYYLYQKYEQRDGQEPIPVYPNVWSIDGDGTMPRVVKLDDDPDCGYVPVDVIYRWINMDISIDYLCENYNKYYKQKKQVSYDSGTTWQDVIPYEYQKGSLYEVNSVDCGYLYLERWVDSGTTCSGYDKYVLQIKQVSNDGGNTWTTTSDTRLGELIAKDSTDCGYVPPLFGVKFNGKYLNGMGDYWERIVECNSSTTLSNQETQVPLYREQDTMYAAIIGDCVTTIGSKALFDCVVLSSVTISDSVTSIGQEAFYNCSSTAFTNIYIPSGVTSIGDKAFGNCFYTKTINIPSGVTIINDYTFLNCSGLTSINIPSGVTSIGYAAFRECRSIPSIDIPDSVRTIGTSAFTSCVSVTSCTIGSGVTSIGDRAFAYCRSLKSVNINNAAASIGNGAFVYCDSITSITLGNNVTSIGEAAFSICKSITSIVIPDSVTSIGKSAFSSCHSLTNIDIPDSVTSIGSQAFDWCSGMTSCTIGSGVTSIGNMAFFDCRGLTSVTVKATTPPTLGSGVFGSTNNCPIYVPSQSVSSYKSATNWSEYANRIQAIPN